MAVRVRLTRVGSKKNPIWRVVVADQRSPRDGRFIETVGQYNPQTHPSMIVLDEERLQHWIARGAQPTGTVKQLMRAHAKGLTPEPAAQPAAPVAEPSISEGSGPAAEAPGPNAAEGAGPDVVEALEPAEPVEPVETAEPVETTDPGERAEPTEPVAIESVPAADPMDAASTEDGEPAAGEAEPDGKPVSE